MTAGVRTGKAQNELVFSWLPPKAVLPPILELLPPPAFCERRHRCLARRRVAVRRRAVLVIAERERPHPGRSYRRGVGQEDAADDEAVGENVVNLVVPLSAMRRPQARRTRALVL